MVNVFSKAIREARTFWGKRARAELEWLLLADADQCGKRVVSEQHDCSGAPPRILDQRLIHDLPRHRSPKGR